MKFIATFCVAMILFAALRHLFTIQVPMLTLNHTETANPSRQLTEVYVCDPEDEEEEIEELGNEQADEKMDELEIEETSEQTEEVKGNPHRVRGVHSWEACFPDINDIQLVAAQKNGIIPVQSREEIQRLIEQHKLVNICNSPFYIVDDLTHSMPYLVPKAQHLLNTICLNFIDSLQVKGLPVHLPMVTSVLRTEEDVSRLQKGNGNATTHSCHCYGTTVDITYNRFVPLLGYYNLNVPLLRWDMKMKQVMAEVLNDLRQQGLCYVKYEKKQACFHLTVR